jgi:hypothetical protein
MLTMKRAWKIAHTSFKDPENMVLLDNSKAALTIVKEFRVNNQ